MKCAWIKAQSSHSVRRLCAVLSVSVSGYYAWLKRKPSARARDDAHLLNQIERIHIENREACGIVRVWRTLRDEGQRCGINRVQRLRQAHAI